MFGPWIPAGRWLPLGRGAFGQSVLKIQRTHTYKHPVHKLTHTHTQTMSHTGGQLYACTQWPLLWWMLTAWLPSNNTASAWVIVAKCLCVLLCGAEKSMLMNTTVPRCLYWPLQTPGTLGTIKTSQPQLLAASPPPRRPSSSLCFSF